MWELDINIYTTDNTSLLKVMSFDNKKNVFSDFVFELISLKAQWQFHFQFGMFEIAHAFVDKCVYYIILLHQNRIKFLVMFFFRPTYHNINGCNKKK